MNKAEMETRIAELEAQIAELTRTPDEVMAENVTLRQQVAQLEAELAEAQLAAEAVAAPMQDIAGMRLDPDDPFAAGTMRVYLGISKATQQQRAYLPFVLPDNDPASVIAATSYIQRAASAGDEKRVAAAREAFGSQSEKVANAQERNGNPLGAKQIRQAFKID